MTAQKAHAILSESGEGALAVTTLASPVRQPAFLDGAQTRGHVAIYPELISKDPT